MNPTRALEAIDSLQKVCPTAFMLFGTLLGAIRDGKFIPWDNDMDFGIMFEDWDENMVAKLEQGGFTVRAHYFWDHPRAAEIVDGNSIGKRSKIQLNHKDTSIRMCLEVLSPGKDGHRYSSAGKFGVFHCPAGLIEDRTTFRFYDRIVNVPVNYEAFLQFMYGDWRTPREKYYKTELHKTNSQRFKIIL